MILEVVVIVWGYEAAADSDYENGYDHCQSGRNEIRCHTRDVVGEEALLVCQRERACHIDKRFCVKMLEEIARYERSHQNGDGEKENAYVRDSRKRIIVFNVFVHHYHEHERCKRKSDYLEYVIYSEKSLLGNKIAAHSREEIAFFTA